jgi:hypothetical protein
MVVKGHLTLHDAHGYLHSVTNIDEYSKVYAHGYPLGGVKYLLKTLVLNLSNMADVAVMFDSSTDRKTISADYKGNRPSAHVVNSQAEFLYERLLQCGIPAYKVKGFEADDLIFSAVEKNRDQYSKISIYTADYDISHNVDSKVTMEPLNSNVNRVTWHNFNYSVVRGKKIMFNTISAHKVFCGDGSDRVHAFSSEHTKLKGATLYEEFCNFLNEGMSTFNVNVTRNPTALKLFIKQLLDNGRLVKEDAVFLLNNLNLVYPRMAEGIDFTGASISQIDKFGLAKILSLTNDYASLKTIRESKLPALEEEIEDLRRRAWELKSGEFAADRNLSFDQEKVVKNELLNLREF